MHHVMFIIICLIWGASFILMREAGLVFGAVTIGAWRVVGSAVLVGLIWRWRRRGWTLRWRDLLPMGVIALIGYIWPFTLQPYLITRHHNSAFFGMMVCLVPLLTIAVSIPMLRVYPTRRQMVGVIGALGFTGLLFIDADTHAISVFDCVLGASVPLAYAVSNNMVKRWYARLDPLVLVFAATGLSGLVLLPIGVATEPIRPADARTMTMAIVALVFLSVVGTGLATLMFYRLIQSHGPLFAGMVTYVVSSSALVWGWLGGELISTRQVIALAGILLMVALVQTQRSTPQPPVAVPMPTQRRVS